MVYYDKKKKRWQLGTAPIDKNRKIESPPKPVPIPEGATHTPWIDLNSDQCQFALDGFFDGPTNRFPCCGLPVIGGNGLGRRLCEYHKNVAEHGVR